MLFARSRAGCLPSSVRGRRSFARSGVWSPRGNVDRFRRRNLTVNRRRYLFANRAYVPNSMRRGYVRRRDLGFNNETYRNSRERSIYAIVTIIVTIRRIVEKRIARGVNEKRRNFARTHALTVVLASIQTGSCTTCPLCPPLSPTSRPRRGTEIARTVRYPPNRRSTSARRRILCTYARG